MKDWTRLQWGALASTTALNILRPNIQRKFDEKLGNKLSKYDCDHRFMIAKGYCYIPGKEDKILELLNPEDFKLSEAGNFSFNAKAFLEQKEVALAFDLVKNSSVDCAHLFVIYYNESKAVPEGLFKGLDEVIESKLRVEIAKALKNERMFEGALEILNPMFQR